VQLFILSSEPLVGGRRINTKVLPNLGYIPRVADLTIRRLKDVTWGQRLQSTGRSEPAWTVGLGLPKREGRELQNLTAANVGRRLVITAEDEPLSAPRIVAPLEGGTISIDVTDTEQLERLKKLLARMPRAP
jgi:preprotein translocase subunit SecD